MPELPEVETVLRVLQPQLLGRTVLSIDRLNSQVVAHPSAAEFAELIAGQTASGMSRRGKFLTIHFTSGDRVVIHLRMTGQLLVTPSDYPTEKHTHLLAELSGGKQLRYIDVRRFGRFWYLKAGETDGVTGQARLGLEPDDDGLTGAYLLARLGKRRKTVKEALNDQGFVAGIGNIYSDEILFAAGLYPGEACAALTEAEWNRLAEKIKEIIAWGIDANRMTAEEYLSGGGRNYRSMPDLSAYGREGQACRLCGSVMERVVIGGRSSVYCPHCQRKKVR